MTDWLTYILTMLVAAASAASSLKFIHMLQLESYQGKMYLKWLKRTCPIAFRTSA